MNPSTEKKYYVRRIAPSQSLMPTNCDIKSSKNLKRCCKLRKYYLQFIGTASTLQLCIYSLWSPLLSHRKSNQTRWFTWGLLPAWSNCTPASTISKWICLVCYRTSLALWGVPQINTKLELVSCFSLIQRKRWSTKIIVNSGTHVLL